MSTRTLHTLPGLDLDQTSGDEGKRLILVAARRILWLLFLLSGFLLIPAISNPQIQATAPFLVALMAIQLLPILWPREVDIASPLVLMGVTGIMAFFSTAGVLAAALTTGEFGATYLKAQDADYIAEVVRTVTIANMLAAVSYMVGFRSRLVAGRFHRWLPKVAGLEWSKVRLRIADAIFLALFVAAYAAFQIRVGIPLWDPTQLKEAKAVWRYDITLSWMLRGTQLAFVPVFFALVDALHERRALRIAAYGGAFALAAYLTFRLGQRGVPLQALLAGILFIHLLLRRISVGVVFVLVLFAVELSNFTLGWRTGHDQEAHLVGESEADLSERVQSTMADYEGDRKRLAAITLVFHEFPRNYDYLLGESWLTLPYALIPRWLYPDKKELYRWGDTSTMTTLTNAPIPTPLQALLYMNFSWFGIAIGMWLWGAFHRGCYDWLNAHPRDRNVVLLYVMIRLYFLPTDMGISNTLQYVIPLWVVIRFIGVRPKEHLTPAPLRAGQVLQGSPGSA